MTEGGAGDECEGEEETRRAADVKYEEFERVCGHLLDPGLSAELAVMESLGLPTKLVNSYNDLESDEVSV